MKTRSAPHRGKEAPIYGTVGRVKIKAENREKFRETLASQGNANIPGFRSAWLMFPENRADEALMVVVFDDRESYGRTRTTRSRTSAIRSSRSTSTPSPSGPTGSGSSRSRDPTQTGITPTGRILG